MLLLLCLYCIYTSELIAVTFKLILLLGLQKNREHQTNKTVLFDNETFTGGVNSVTSHAVTFSAITRLPQSSISIQTIGHRLEKRASSQRPSESLNTMNFTSRITSKCTLSSLIFRHATLLVTSLYTYRYLFISRKTYYFHDRWRNLSMVIASKDRVRVNCIFEPNQKKSNLPNDIQCINMSIYPSVCKKNENFDHLQPFDPIFDFFFQFFVTLDKYNMPVESNFSVEQFKRHSLYHFWSTVNNNSRKIKKFQSFAFQSSSTVCI